MKMLITKTSYIVDGELFLLLYGRDEKGKRVEHRVGNTEPYFYVKDIGDTIKQLAKHPKIRRVEKCGRTIFDEPLYKITVRYPFDVPEVRAKFPITYEADIVYGYRKKIDFNITDGCEIRDGVLIPCRVDIKPRVWHFDAEMSDAGGLPDAKYPTAPVYSFVIYDTQTNKYLAFIQGKKVKPDFVKRMKDKHNWDVVLKCVPDEETLFAALEQMLRQFTPDILTGWYVDGFDVPYLQARATHCNFKFPEFKKICVFNLQAGMRKLMTHDMDDKSLQFNAMDLLGEGKQQRDACWREYENDPDGLLEYNIKDVELTKRLDEKTDTLNTLLMLCRRSGVELEDTLWNSKFIDQIFLHRIKGQFQSPTKASLYNKFDKGWYKNKGKKFDGALVQEASNGVFFNVLYIDVKSMYPSIIQTFNISPETTVNAEFNEPCYTTPLGHRYRAKPVGLFPVILKEMIDERNDLKRRSEQTADPILKKNLYTNYKSVRFINASFFGVIASEAFRWMDIEMASDIPDIGQRIEIWNKDFAEKHGWKVIYGDTDSLMLVLPNATYDDTRVLGQKLVKELNESYADFVKPFGITKHFLEIEIEDIYPAFFQAGSKKRYALLDKDGKVEITGFEAVRSDKAPYVRKLQKKLIDMILKKADKHKIKDEIVKAIDDMHNNRVEWTEFRMPVGMNKINYSNMPEHVRAAEWSNKYLDKDFNMGDKVNVYFGYIKGLPDTDVFALKWNDKLPEGAVIDVAAMIRKHLELPLRPVYEYLGITWDEIVSGMSQKGIDDFL